MSRIDVAPNGSGLPENGRRKPAPDPNGTVMFFSVFAQRLTSRATVFFGFGRTLILLGLSGRDYM